MSQDHYFLPAQDPTGLPWVKSASTISPQKACPHHSNPVVGSSTSMLRAICVSQVLGPTYSLSEQWHLLAWGSGGPGNIQIRRTLHLFIPCQDLTSWITDLPTLMDAAAWPLPQRSLTVYPPWFCLLCSLPPGSHNDILPLFDF